MEQGRGRECLLIGTSSRVERGFGLGVMVLRVAREMEEMEVREDGDVSRAAWRERALMLLT
jgi:hypothetical protein